jgi:hypothetical protein
MPSVRIRSLLAATAVAAVLPYSFLGHGLSPMSSHEGMAGATTGLCLLLVTVLGFAATPKLEAQHAAVVAEAAPAYVGLPPRPPLDGRARASPSALQRFRN